MALLNVISGINDNKLKRCLMYILTAARLLWAQKWKTEEVPTIEELLKKLWDTAELDTIRSTMGTTKRLCKTKLGTNILLGPEEDRSVGQSL